MFYDYDVNPYLSTSDLMGKSGSLSKLSLNMAKPDPGKSVRVGYHLFFNKVSVKKGREKKGEETLPYKPSSEKLSKSSSSSMKIKNRRTLSQSKGMKNSQPNEFDN